MKKILLAAVAGLLLVACNNTAKFEAPIESLSAKWDSTQTVVAGFAGMLTQEIANVQSMATGMVVTEEAKAKLDDAGKAKLAELESGWQAESQGLTALNDEVNAFVASWGEKTQKLTGLKDGLAAAKLGKETDATITELETAVTEAGTQVTAWTDKMNAAKAKLAEIAKQHGEMFAATTATMSSGKKAGK